MHLAPPLRLVLYRPGLEKLFEESRLGPIVHRLHVCRNRVAFHVDVLLRWPGGRLQLQCLNCHLIKQLWDGFDLWHDAVKMQYTRAGSFMQMCVKETLTNALAIAACLSTLLALFPFHTKIFVPP